MAGQRRRRRMPALVLAGLLVLTLGGAAAAWGYGQSLNAGLKRTDAFRGLRATDRPAPTVVGAMNVLLLGSDARDPTAGDARTDTMMLLHLDADHRHAYVISIPRDLWVHVPPDPDGNGNGDTMAKINSAYAWGGTPLAVATVEEYTAVRVDHVVLIDFGGLREVVDALGGVDLTVDQTITSIFPPYHEYQQGRQHLPGWQALDYIRQRYQYPDGDLARERHQQQLLAAMLDKAATAGTLTDPGRLNSFLRALTGCLTVDQGFDLVSVALQLRGLRGPDISYLTSPIDGGGFEGEESVVYPDQVRGPALYQAVRQDTVAGYLARQPPATVTPTPVN
jgi:LCP family protein required for cell wall assembly